MLCLPIGYVCCGVVVLGYLIWGGLLSMGWLDDSDLFGWWDVLRLVLRVGSVWFVVFASLFCVWLGGWLYWLIFLVGVICLICLLL